MTRPPPGPRATAPCPPAASDEAADLIGPDDLGEVFHTLERLADGDPEARAPEGASTPFATRLHGAVNRVAEHLSELVQDAHEFAMGLTEHFDVLQRVARGDLSARIENGSPVEILQYLRRFTNETIEALELEIGARRTAEQGLARLAVAVEQAAEGILITDRSALCQYVNPSFETITGLATRDLAGKSVWPLLRQYELLGSSPPPWRELRAGRVWSGQFTTRRKDGSAYQASCTISPVRDAEGRITNYVTAVRDVTAERDLERRLNQSQRLEAIGTLAGGIAHEFNNLLTVIIGFTEMSLATTGEGGETGRNLVRVLEAGERARNLVRQILTFSRNDEEDDDRAGPAELVPVLRETLELLRASLPASIRIVDTLDGGELVVTADAAQVQQVLMNLGTNAAHAMRETGGELHVALAELTLREGEPPPVHELSPGTYAALTVRDSGCGMAREVRERVFEPFFTTKPVGQGTGLGLAVVHGIVRSCGGGIALTSEPGQGTSFQIYLPLTKRQAATREAAAPRQLPPGLPHGGEHVLVVDDERPIVELLKAQLTRLGYTVDTCLGSREALVLLRADPSRFDLVLTDQTMPDLTGIALAREVRSLRPDLPVLLCTGHSDESTPDGAAAVGIREILFKPLTFRELADAVRRALD